MRPRTRREWIEDLVAVGVVLLALALLAASKCVQR